MTQEKLLQYLKALLKVYRNKVIEIENTKFNENDKRSISVYASNLGKMIVIDDITNYDKRWETKSDVDSLIKKMEKNYEL